MVARKRERYSLGYGPISTAVMASRNAIEHVGFFLDELRPGMRVLDVGCGPGPIPLDLRQYVEPGGSVVGVDVEPGQIEVARKRAAERQIADVTFEAATAYELPFEDNSFDALLMAALLGNLQQPDVALKEAFRVLKPGGVIAIKDFDHGGDLYYPEVASLKKIIELYNRFRIHNGHDPNSGRKTYSRLVQAGFVNAQIVARYTMLAGEQLKTNVQEFAALALEAWAEPVAELGWADEKTVEALANDLIQNPPDFVADAWCEGIAYKPKQ